MENINIIRFHARCHSGMLERNEPLLPLAFNPPVLFRSLLVFFLRKNNSTFNEICDYLSLRHLSARFDHLMLISAQHFRSRKMAKDFRKPPLRLGVVWFMAKKVCVKIGVFIYGFDLFRM